MNYLRTTTSTRTVGSKKRRIRLFSSIFVARKSLKSGNTLEIPRLMRDSHESLRSDFEVSCTELDILVQIASSKAGAHGARMTGGGFGGCTINLVEASMTDAFVRQVREEYQQKTGLLSKMASEGAQTAELEAKPVRAFS